MNRQKRVYGVGSKIGLGRVTTSSLQLHAVHDHREGQFIAEYINH